MQREIISALLAPDVTTESFTGTIWYFDMKVIPDPTGHGRVRDDLHVEVPDRPGEGLGRNVRREQRGDDLPLHHGGGVGDPPLVLAALVLGVKESQLLVLVRDHRA